MRITVKLEQLLTVDETGLPKPPSIRQIQDKDVLELYKRDTTSDKRKYTAEVGVIYYLGDPNSIVRQQGLSDAECLKEAIINYGLPKDYKPDILVDRLIKKYRHQNMTEAGVVVEGCHKAIHLSALAIVKVTELLTAKMAISTTIEDVEQITNLLKQVNNISASIPSQIATLKQAQENLINEEEEINARGGQNITSSQLAD